MQKLLQQLKTLFKRTIKCNKYQSKITVQTQNKGLNYLIDSSFQWVNRLFVLSFEGGEQRASHVRYFFLTVNIKDYKNGRKCFHQSVKNDRITYDNVKKNCDRSKKMIRQTAVY